jgi:hypothetical protein
MNPFTDIIFIFVFVFTLLQFGLINIDTTHPVLVKIYIFIAVTLFAFMLHSMKAIRRVTHINIWDIVTSGVIVGFLSFVGSTFYYDMVYTAETKPIIVNMIDNTYFTENVMLCLFISTSVMIGKSAVYIFNIESCP